MSKRGGCGCLGFLFKSVFWIAAMGVIAYVVLFGYLLLKEHTQSRPGSYEAIIVLGAQVNPDGQPSVQLRLRLEKALEMYKKNPKPIVVTGARGENEPATEAYIMKSWLTQYGVPASMIFMEEISMNTKENIQNAMKLLPAGTMDILIVTSDYHLPRALQIARDLGLNPYGAGSPIKQEFWLKNHSRETLAWGKYILQKFIPIP